MILSPEYPSEPNYSSGEWLDTLTYYEVGDKVTYPSRHGDEVLTVTRIRAVRPGDYKFALHTQYVELSDQMGIIENNISAALIQPIGTKE